MKHLSNNQIAVGSPSSNVRFNRVVGAGGYVCNACIKQQIADKNPLVSPNVVIMPMGLNECDCCETAQDKTFMFLIK